MDKLHFYSFFVDKKKLINFIKTIFKKNNKIFKKIQFTIKEREKKMNLHAQSEADQLDKPGI